MITDPAKPRICRAMTLGETGRKPSRKNDTWRIPLAPARAGCARETEHWPGIVQEDESGMVMECAGSMPPNGQDNRRGAAASGLIAGLGRWAKPDTSPAEHTIRKEYHLRLPELDVTSISTDDARRDPRHFQAFHRC